MRILILSTISILFFQCKNIASRHVLVKLRMAEFVNSTNYADSPITFGTAGKINTSNSIVSERNPDGKGYRIHLQRPLLHQGPVYQVVAGCQAYKRCNYGQRCGNLHKPKCRRCSFKQCLDHAMSEKAYGFTYQFSSFFISPRANRVNTHTNYNNCNMCTRAEVHESFLSPELNLGGYGVYAAVDWKDGRYLTP